MIDLLWLGCGMLLAGMVQCLIRFWCQREDRKRQEKAAKVLKRHGLIPQLYLPTIGEKDPELRSALDAFTLSGRIITNAKGEVVGKLCPKVAEEPHLRLVVSNT